MPATNSRRVDVDIIKDEPLTLTQFAATHTFPDDVDEEEIAVDYQQYLDRFQPYRWSAVAANNEPVAHGESYFHEADAINAVELLFGDDTTMYWRSRDPERGDQLLRYGITDREHQG